MELQTVVAHRNPVAAKVGTYVLLEMQCCAAAECLPPSRLSQLSNQLLLGSFHGFRAAAQVANWASHTLRRRVWGATHHFPLTVTTQLGQTATVDAVSLASAVYMQLYICIDMLLHMCMQLHVCTCMQIHTYARKVL